jgi:hypothetical protein
VTAPLRHDRTAAPRGTRTAAVAAESARPALRLVAGRHRAARFVMVLAGLVCMVMAGAAVLHTRLAERQLEIDRLERSVVVAQERFDELRAQRAELRSPTRLATESDRLGLQPATGTEFVMIDPATVARVVAAGGRTSAPTAAAIAVEPLDQFRLVKRVAGGAP